MDYIIVQAGGKGTRLEYLTKNKPKALVPVNNLPMIFHLFSMYPDKRFVIIADYKKEVMREYLDCFCNVKYQIVDAEGTGTCSGIAQALQLIPDDEAFMLVWSDLILPKDFRLPQGYADIADSSAQSCTNTAGTHTQGCTDAADLSAWGCADTTIAPDRDYIGISTTFPCRWKYENGEFAEERSTEFGVAGFFLFHNKRVMQNVPQSGELVRWMQEQHMKFENVSLAGTREFGLLAEYLKLGVEKCRPFNRMTIEGDIIIKEGINEQGQKLAKRECAWYDKARTLGIAELPVIYDTNPLKMERINGGNIYEYDLPYEQKLTILQKLVHALKKLHASSTVKADSFSTKEAYFNKTFDRIDPIRNLVPFADRQTITINGKSCRNVFFHRRELEKKIDRIRTDHFAFIHGDCTFSNMMLREDGSPVLIDPRGYFGYSELYGDELYDWAKLYYSIVGNYDHFNLKNFRLDINTAKGKVLLDITSSHWEELEDKFFELTGADPYEVKLIHAVIWLSLTTYAWQDYDSVCGAFYNGLYYLEDLWDGR